MELVYKKERTLFIISAVIATVLWLAFIVGTLGVALVYILLALLIYLFAQSAFISYLKGTAVRITPGQFPDLHQRVVQACTKLGMEKIPEAYLLHGNGIFNAFATRFLGRNFIALYSDIVDALASRPDALDFYIGHELGHIHRRHLVWAPLLWPARILPLLGAAYSRAREYTCDLYGLACCKDPQDACYGLAALAACNACRQPWVTFGSRGIRRSMSADTPCSLYSGRCRITQLRRDGGTILAIAAFKAAPEATRERTR